ncbi:MAG: hypothetical protein HQM04_12460 [Magnetococcales bacterium]|nr:hypothetical protein [Magnetococcales bacterium]MBF0115837.1 hypothetical protein [Magnetococcales bacterium]
MATNQVGYIGSGPLFIGKRSGGKMRFVGQVPEFKLDITEETKELKDYVKGSGLAESVSFISKVEASITFASADVHNLVLALRGVEDATSATPVTSEAHTAYPGGLVELQGVSPKSVSVTIAPAAHAVTTAYTVGQLVKPTAGTHFYKCKVAGTSGASVPSWQTDGTDTSDGTVTWTDMGLMALTSSDYEINSAGLFISANSTKIDEEGTPVEVSYTTSAGYNIQALVGAGEEYRVVFAGKNFARNGKGLKVVMYRVVFSPTKELGLISDEFAKLTLTAKVLSDDTKTGTDISAFCEIDMEAV